MRQHCQSCGAELFYNDKVIRVSYGSLYWTAHPHTNVKRTKQDDYFHVTCPVAIREDDLK